MGELTLLLLNSTKRKEGRIVAALVILFSALSSIGCGKPPVRLSIVGGRANIDVQTLGEYPTTIIHVLLQNSQSHATIWEIRAKSGTPQLHGLSLKEGDNTVSLADPDTGTYEIVSPSNSKTFHLDRGIRYELSLWQSANSSPARVAIEFTY